MNRGAWVDPELGQTTVEEWVSSMEDSGLSASRVRQAFNVLAAMLDAAIANGMLVRNVAPWGRAPGIPKSKRRFLTEEQVIRLADTVPPEYRSLTLVLAYSGMRWGEAVALRRGRCNLLRRLRLDSGWRRLRSKGDEGTIEQGTGVSELPRATGTDDR